jgi:hypothetical protein
VRKTSKFWDNMEETHDNIKKNYEKRTIGYFYRELKWIYLQHTTIFKGMRKNE